MTGATLPSGFYGKMAAVAKPFHFHIVEPLKEAR
jgi:hypothetical protein